MRALLPLLVLAAAAATSGAADPVPCGPDDLAGPACPDLVVDSLTASDVYVTTETFAASHCAVVEDLVLPGTRTLLRFPMATANLGRAPLHLGNPSLHPEWYTPSPCHGHLHFDGFAEYRLWTPYAYAGWAALRTLEPDRNASDLLAENPDLAAGLAAGRKQGFCVMDVAQVAPAPLPPGYPHCGYQGLSVGYEDRYEPYLDGQWIDVTGMPEGQYVLELETNPARRIVESGYGDNAAALLVWVGQ